MILVGQVWQRQGDDKFLYSFGAELLFENAACKYCWVAGWIFERWKDICLRFVGSTVFHRLACNLILFSSFTNISAFVDLRIVLYTLTMGVAG